ncbi:MAG: TonB-dependent receptor, partial [bacterium]|nr:TonB-dependent receptor [bacterium]
RRRLPYRVSNWRAAKNYGAEIVATWRATRFWKLSGSYSWLKVALDAGPSREESAVAGLGARIVPHQAGARSYLDLPGRLQLDTGIYFVDALRQSRQTHSPLDRVVPAFGRFDTRLGWRPRRDLELSLTWQNLLDNQHPEFSSLEFPSSEIRRGVFGKMQWRF